MGDAHTDADAWMISEELGLGQTPEQACPVVRTLDLVALSLRHQAGDLLGVIRAAAELSQGRDLLLMAGSGAMSGVSGHKLVCEMEAKVLLVDRYENQHFIDNLLCTRDRLGPALLGVVINSVDPEINEALEELVLPFLAAACLILTGNLNTPTRSSYRGPRSTRCRCWWCAMIPTAWPTDWRACALLPPCARQRKSPALWSWCGNAWASRPCTRRWA